MLLPYTTLEYYGPGAIASAPGDSWGVFEASVKGTGRARATIPAVATMPLAHVTGLKHRPCTMSGSGVVTSAAVKARAKPSAMIKVNALSQDDVTGAVLEANVANGLSLKAAINLLLANMGGGGSILTAAEIASAVRAEITTELARVDVAVSSRATPAQVDSAVGAIPADAVPPTAGEVAASVLSAIQSSPIPIPANTVEMNGAALTGTGKPGDKWRGV